MPRPDRDVGAFEARAAGYDQGWRGRLHHEIAERTLSLVTGGGDRPRRVLDVGCGTGYLLERLAGRLPDAVALDGVDPAPSMAEVAATRSSADRRVQVTAGVAEHLPYPDGRFDLVVTTTSFDHWSDQRAGLRECARVLTPGGRLVLVDQFSRWLAPTLVARRRGKARTVRRADRLLAEAGFGSRRWHDLYGVIIKAVTATA